MEQRFSVDCAVNPRTGKERELAVHPAARSKHVVVIGGGPAGMEAASRPTAGTGSRCSNTTVNSAVRCCGHRYRIPENEPFLSYLRGEIGRSTAKVVLRHEVSFDDVVDLRPDAVVVATGGRVVLPSVTGAGLPHVRNGPALREPRQADGRSASAAGATRRGPDGDPGLDAAGPPRRHRRR